MRLVRRAIRVFAVAVMGVTAVGAATMPASAAGGGPLPDTGSSVQWWLIVAIAVLVAGAGLYGYSQWSSRRGGSGDGATEESAESAGGSE